MLITLCAVLLIYARMIEPRNIELTTYHIAVPNLPPEMDGFKIVQLSDLHRRFVVPDDIIKKAVRVANSTHADAAVLTGDYVGYKSVDINPCFDMLEDVHTRLGSFAVLGNHDHWTDADAVNKSIKDHGITLLTNSSAKLTKGLFLVGIDDEWAGHPNAHAAFKKTDSKACCVMICHSPLSVSRFGNRKGLLITGHTHGGQINIPFVPRNHLPGLKGWQYIKGWHEVGGILMYVNRGIGMVNPAIRFHCRPEVTLFILHRAKGSKPYLMKNQAS